MGVMNEKTNFIQFNKLYSWFAGLSGDLLFWTAIDTLFLTIVKDFNASQIASLTSIALITCILIQVPLLNIIKRIGNTRSVRLGSFLLLVSSILLTFGTNYIIIVMGEILYHVAYIFQNIKNVILKNNLELQNRENEYIKFNTNANIIYAIVTMVISFMVTFMFNINHYLPMIFCIMFCFLCFILSFYIIDYSKNEFIENNITKDKIYKPKNIRYTKIILIIIISYGLFYSIIYFGQSNGKLFIQQELLKEFNVENTALIIGSILCTSRIVRVISNISFNKMHKKYKNKVGIILPFLLLLSSCLMVGGYLISFSIIFKIVIMSLGYIIILFIRDLFAVYMQDLALKKVEKEQQRSLLIMLDLSKTVMRSIISLIFTAILVNNPMVIVIIILIVLSIIEVFISFHLYNVIWGNE